MLCFVAGFPAAAAYAAAYAGRGYSGYPGLLAGCAGYPTGNLPFLPPHHDLGPVQDQLAHLYNLHALQL